MSRRRWAAALAGGTITAALGLTAVLAQTGGPYAITWWSTPGGGGTSSQGTYIVNAVVGQPFASESTGGVYNVQSGFLGGSAVRYRLFMPLVASDD